MNTSSCSDSSSLADGISSSAEAICCEASASSQEALNEVTLRSLNRKNSSPNLIRHSTPSKTGLRFFVSNNDDSDESDSISLPDSPSNQRSLKCETTFSRTTTFSSANNAGYPNCGTFFVQHISDDEYQNNNFQASLSASADENSNSAYASPNSIRKLVSGAEQLVYIPNDDSDVDYRPQSETNLRCPKVNLKPDR